MIDWKHIGRRLAALALGAALCLGLTACGGRDAGGPEYAGGPEFTVAVAQTPDSFNPVLAGEGLAQEFFLLAYDPLWRLGADGLPQACLAEDWSLSSDRLTWTIRLRRDAVFSDGIPLTAADVLFSYELFRHGDSPYREYFDGITAIRQADDYTVVVSTEYVKGDLPYNPSPILPRHIWRAYEFSPSSFENSEMIGSGPFTYDADASGDGGWRFRARADYFGGAPQIGGVFFRSYGTVTAAARAVSAGEADASFGLTDVQLTTLTGVPGVELVEAVLPSAVCAMLVMNTRNDFFGNDTMRRMAEYSADKAWFLAMASGGAGELGSSFVSPGLPFFSPPDGLRDCAPETARSLLAAAGYADADGDGVLEYGPRAAELSLRMYSSSQDEWAATAATILAADLGELGVSVDWRKTDGAVTSVCGDGDDWDMCLLGWRGSASAVVTALRFRDELGALTGWSSQSYDSDLLLLRSAEEPAVSLGYARRLQQTVYDACPVIVLGYGADVQAIRSDRWTGYEEQLAGGGLFRVGNADVYLRLSPRTAESGGE